MTERVERRAAGLFRVSTLRGCAGWEQDLDAPPNAIQTYKAAQPMP
jgi:hypothetical protein